MKLHFLLVLLGILTLPYQNPEGSNVSNFKSWRRLTAKPVDVSYRLSALCATVLKDDKAMADPHTGNQVHVYVNPVGQAVADSTLRAIRQGRKPRQVAFPPGSILVKSKFARPASPGAASMIELLTVMVKQPEGSFKSTGGWKFLVMDGAGKKVLEDSRQSKCYSCHASMPYDHVSFQYGK